MLGEVLSTVTILVFSRKHFSINKKLKKACRRKGGKTDLKNDSLPGRNNRSILFVILIILCHLIKPKYFTEMLPLLPVNVVVELRLKVTYNIKFRIV